MQGGGVATPKARTPVAPTKWGGSRSSQGKKFSHQGKGGSSKGSLCGQTNNLTKYWGAPVAKGDTGGSGSGKMESSSKGCNERGAGSRGGSMVSDGSDVDGGSSGGGGREEDGHSHRHKKKGLGCSSGRWGLRRSEDIGGGGDSSCSVAQMVGTPLKGDVCTTPPPDKKKMHTLGGGVLPCTDVGEGLSPPACMSPGSFYRGLSPTPPRTPQTPVPPCVKTVGLIVPHPTTRESTEKKGQPEEEGTAERALDEEMGEGTGSEWQDVKENVSAEDNKDYREGLPCQRTVVLIKEIKENRPPGSNSSTLEEDNGAAVASKHFSLGGVGGMGNGTKLSGLRRVSRVSGRVG
ncbi:unnamed protein product, partial [Choristocarpus tenellus]